MLGVVKVNKQQLFTLKTDISANSFQNDDGFWNVLVQISVFNVSSCCLFTLTTPKIE